MIDILTTFNSAFRNKRVFVTGHTGFKGSWLCQWLLMLGAKVAGFSLPPPTNPALFDLLDLKSKVQHIQGDIRDFTALSQAIKDYKPDFVFHLAAQSLVRESYTHTLDTYSINLMGTTHVLECLRSCSHACVGIMVTTDKCYENREWLYGYREEDPLGGYDPYSASKATAEIAINSYRQSFFQKHPVKIASVRAGNVIGGGDWAVDRIVPDCIRALSQNLPICVRNPQATRPWQHVLEPLSGYLWLAARLSETGLSDAGCNRFASAFNFGPNLEANRTVRALVEEILKHWSGQWIDQSNPDAVHEASFLQLTFDKAYHLLGWAPVWSFSEAIAETTQWYRSICQNRDATLVQRLTTEQISRFEKTANRLGRSWVGVD